MSDKAGGGLAMLFVGIAAAVFIMIFLGVMTGSVYQTGVEPLASSRYADRVTEDNITMILNTQMQINNTLGRATYNIINGTVVVYNGTETFNITGNGSIYPSNSSYFLASSAAYAKNYRVNYSYYNNTVYAVYRDAPYQAVIALQTGSSWFPLLIVAVMIFVALTTVFVVLYKGRPGNENGGSPL